MRQILLCDQGSDIWAKMISKSESPFLPDPKAHYRHRLGRRQTGRLELRVTSAGAQGEAAVLESGARVERVRESECCDDGKGV